MNRFKDGTLIVVIAAAIVAVLILMTDRETTPSVTEDTNVITQKKEKDTQEIIAQNEEPTIVESVDSVISQEVVTPLNEGTEVKAPKGPFNNSANDSIEKNISVSEDKEVSPTLEKDIVDNQEQNDSVKLESNNVVTESSETEVQAQPSQPIWLDQKLGDFKSIEESDVVFKMMPISPNGLQGNDPKGVVTNNSDKFAPLTVSSDYNYQQMPMYNGGYYIAPMPSYLMSSTLPVKQEK